MEDSQSPVHDVAAAGALRRSDDSLQAIGELASKVVHDINNPLAGIQSAFMLIKDSILPSHPYYRYVGAIEREIQRIAGVTGRLALLHRPRAESADGADRPGIISHAMQQLLDVALQSSLPEHPIQLNAMADAAGWEIALTYRDRNAGNGHDAAAFQRPKHLILALDGSLNMTPCEDGTTEIRARLPHSLPFANSQ